MFHNNYFLYLFKQGEKYYLQAKYDFNVINDNEIKMKNSEDIADWIEKNAIMNSLVVTEDILFIPKGLLKTQIKEACKRYYDKFRHEGYCYSTFFKEWNYPYKIFGELSLYSTNEFTAKKEMFVQKCTIEQLAWLEYKYKNISFPSKSSYSMEEGREKYPIVKNLQEEVYNIETFKKNIK